MNKIPSRLIDSVIEEFSEHVKEFMDSKEITLDVAILLLATLKLKYQIAFEDYKYTYLSLEQDSDT